ncbi:GNAT family N-acetyltransferase [Paenibacillus sp. NEAU-GSW1]|uniref:GNAT family N-acetyltransferase n=1 Tax=Paenibacillus sp. NEAU-GSW1 TaxID=2682486 RepID=UPI0012E13C67|nr:GNAT family N-acetyltransferase [Paenibacillus sp. NEAU-GSW1]MUT64733.1 GNAT family N-acetyltransferase [Paenibacillus sp. NEAU-GSW1]
MYELSGECISIPDMLDRLQTIKESMNGTIYVLEQESEVLGTLVFQIRENIREVSRYGEVCIIVVKSQAKRNGIGRELMAFAEQKAKELRCKGTYLISGFGRKDEAHQFYLELGYTITGYRFVKPLSRSVEDETFAIS